MNEVELSEATGRNRLYSEVAHVIDNVEIAPQVWLITLGAERIARACLSGQFVNLRLPNDDAEILRLPFSVYTCDFAAGTFTLMYQVLGQGTRRLTALGVGDNCSVVGPIGQGWNPPASAKRALLVSGGLGAAPLTMLAQGLAAAGVETDICMGAPSSERLVGRDLLSECGSVSVATDDGSEGHHGFCTQVSADLLAENGYDYLATCGPGPMQHIVATQALERSLFCEVSLERLMACGIGACLSCVVDTIDGKKRACVDGPVFDASKVVW